MNDPLRQATIDPRMSRLLQATAEFDRTMTQFRAFATQFEEMLASMRALRASVETLSLSSAPQMPTPRALAGPRPDAGSLARRFDERVDRHEHRIVALEARLASPELEAPPASNEGMNMRTGQYL